MKKKYPCIKCTKELWNEIKPVLKSFNIDGFCEVYNFKKYPYLVSNYGSYSNNKLKFGNVDEINLDKPNSIRYLVKTKEEFLSAVAKLLDKEYSAIGESNTVVTVMPEKGNDFDKDKGSDLDIDKPMEKINITDKLKYCKKGTKLYSPIYGEVEFDESTNDSIYVKIIDIDNNISSVSFNKYGQFYNVFKDAECLLFPSKDNRDWNNFQVLEEGHRVMVSDNGKDWYLRNYIKNNITSCVSDKNYTDSWKYIVPIKDFDFITEELIINKEKSII